MGGGASKASLLLDASRKGEIEKVRAAISEKSALVSAKEKETGDTALHLAAREGHFLIIQELLKAGADIASVNAKGNSALHEAALNRKCLVTQYLCERGSDVRATNNEGMTALHVAAMIGSAATLHCLCEYESQVNTQIAVNGKYYQYTPLHLAAEFKNGSCCKVLLNYGANANLENESAETAFDIATKMEDANCIKILDKKGIHARRKAKKKKAAHSNAAARGKAARMALMSSSSTTSDGGEGGNENSEVENAAGEEQVDPLMVMLKMFSFDHFYEALTDMGVDEVQDLIKVTDEDICDFLGARAVEQRRFARWRKAGGAEGGHEIATVSCHDALQRHQLEQYAPYLIRRGYVFESDLAMIDEEDCSGIKVLHRRKILEISDKIAIERGEKKDAHMALAEEAASVQEKFHSSSQAQRARLDAEKSAAASRMRKRLLKRKREREKREAKEEIRPPEPVAS